MNEQYQVHRFARNLARRLAKLERAQRKTARAAGDLRHSAIDGGQGLTLKDADGNVAYRLGTDANGVTAPEYVGGPVPAQPAPPHVDAGQRVVKVQLSGLDADEGPAPTDFWRAEVHVSLDDGFEPSLSTLATYIDEPNGSATHSLPAGEWYVGVVWVTLSKQRSIMSDLVVADIEPPVDAEEIEADLEDARQRIQDAREYADEQFEAFDERVESAETDLNDAHDRIDAAEGALSTTQSDLDDAKADITAAQSAADQAIADALAAANLAEGKGQVISQVSAPTGSRAREENLWVRLPDMKVHYYDGDKWKPVLDPDTIAAAQQAANALTKANDLQTKHDALKLAVDGEGGLKDRLSTAENTLEDKADSSALSELDQKLDAIEIPDVSGLASKTELQQGLQDAATDAQTKADAAVTKARETLEAFAHAGDNLIYNGSFEHGWDGWRSPRGEIVEDDDARSGEHILVLGRETGNDYPMTEYVSAEKGHVYLVEYWAKKLPGGTDPRELRLYTQTLLTDGSTPGAYARNEQGAIVLADVADMPENEWVKLSGTIEVTHDTATGISFGPHILATGTQFHIDVLRAVDVTEAKAALEAAASAQATADEAHEAAGTAQSTADSALTMAGSKSKVTYSTNAPAGTATVGDTHRQQDESGSIIGEWEYVDDGWQKRQVSSDAISNLDVGKLTAGTATVAEGVFGKLWADDVAVNNLQAREGWVGGVNLEDGAVTAEKIHATREMITKIMGAEWAYISEQLVVEGELIANNADIISAVIKNLDVTEQSNFNDAFAQKLGTKEFTALVATMARAIIAAPNLLPSPDADDASEFWSPISRNTNHPSLWIQGRYTRRSTGTVRLDAGEEYRFKTAVAASVANTRYYIQLVGTGSTPNLYIASNQVAGASQDDWADFESTFTVAETGDYHINIYANHNNGVVGEDNYQWFRTPRIERMLDGRLTVPGSIDVGSLNVTEEMVASFARILHLVVDQIDVNALWADTTWQTAGYFGAEQAGFRTTVNGQGITTEQQFEGEYQPASRLGGPDQALTFWDEARDPTATIERTGDAAFQMVESDVFTHQGRRIFGPNPAPEFDGPILDALPRGIRDKAQADMSGVTVVRQQYGFLEVSAHVETGREYRVRHDPFLMGNGTSYFGEYTYTFSETSPPDAPHTESDRLGNRWRIVTDTTSSHTGGETTFTAPDTGTIRILLTVGRTSGTGDISFHTSSQYTNITLTLEDIGPSRRWAGMRRYAGHGGVQPDRDNQPLSQGFMTAWTPTWQQVYRGGTSGTGGHHQHTTSTIIQGTNNQNYFASIIGGYRTNTAIRGDHAGQTMNTALTSRRILSGRLVTTGSAQAQSGLTNFYWHAYGQAPERLSFANRPPNAAISGTNRAGSTRAFQIPQDMLDAIQNGTFQGLTIHPIMPSGERDTRYYHGIHGVTGNNPPTIELTYEDDQE